MNTVTPELARCNLKTIEGETISFSSLYRDQTTLIFFVRHFGCIFCRERVSSLAHAQSILDAQQLKAVVIGNGHPHMAKSFVEELGLVFPVFCDQEGTAYRLAGMRRNFGLNLSSIKDAWRSYQSGYRQHKTAGDVWQQGGVLVVNSEGTILEACADQSAGEYIDIPQLIDRIAMSKLA